MTSSGELLPKGKAKELYERYLVFKSTLPPSAQPAIPDAVCFTISELELYLSEANSLLAAAGVPQSQRCVALMPGKYGSEASKPHLNNKTTVMFIASRAEGDETGKVTLLENCVVGNEGDDNGNPIGDLSYNVGDLYP